MWQSTGACLLPSSTSSWTHGKDLGRVGLGRTCGSRGSVEADQPRRSTCPPLFPPSALQRRGWPHRGQPPPPLAPAPLAAPPRRSHASHRPCRMHPGVIPQAHEARHQDLHPPATHRPSSRHTPAHAPPSHPCTTLQSPTSSPTTAPPLPPPHSRKRHHGATPLAPTASLSSGRAHPKSTLSPPQQSASQTSSTPLGQQAPPLIRPC